MKLKFNIKLIIVISVYLLLISCNNNNNIDYIYDKALNRLENNKNINIDEIDKAVAFEKTIENIITNEIDEDDRNSLIRQIVNSDSDKGYIIIVSLINYYAKQKNRNKLIKIISLKCPEHYYGSSIEFNISVIYQKYFTDPIYILFETYDISKKIEVKNIISRSIKRSFCAYNIFNENDNNDLIIIKSKKWYNINKYKLKVNEDYEQDNLPTGCRKGLFIFKNGIYQTHLRVITGGMK